MGDGRRFTEYAAYIHRNFPRARLVADVAGGAGRLNVALSRLGHDVTTHDPAAPATARIRVVRALFTVDTPGDFDLIVGLHPDAATDVIVVVACARRVPFVVVPCCVLPTATRFDGPRNARAWMAHLERTAVRGGMRVERGRLRITGQADVLTGRPARV